MKLSLARSHFPFVATFVLALAFAGFFIETVKLGSRQEPIFTTDDVVAMRMQVRGLPPHVCAVPVCGTLRWRLLLRLMRPCA